MPPTIKTPAPAGASGLPVLVDLIHRGDGTYILKPSPLNWHEAEHWITVKQAAKLLGNASTRSVSRLLGVFLVYRRPLPSRVQVSLRSALALQRAIHDPEFWETTAFQKPIKEAVRKEMDRLVALALQRN